jgi:hypothetical protein
MGFKRQDVEIWTEFILARTGTSAEDGNEPSVSIKGG